MILLYPDMGGGYGGGGDSGAMEGGDQASNLVTVPMDMLPGCKVGDTYKVTSAEGGQVVMEKEMGGGDEVEDWKASAKSAVPTGEEAM